MIDPRNAEAPAGGGWDFEEGHEIVPGRFAIGLLGTSRTHDVYTAWDETILGIVAIKLPRPGKLGDDATLRVLATEGEVLRRLSHPSFPRCFDMRLDDYPPHLVLELVEGPRLSTLIRRQRRLGVEQVVPLVLQICSAIHYLATQGLLHLDVKPKNVIMAPPPRLIDLSIARSVDAARASIGPLGPTSMWRRSSAVPGVPAASATRPTCGDSARRCTRRSRAGRRSRGEIPRDVGQRGSPS